MLGSSAVASPAHPGRRPQTGGFAPAPLDAFAFYKLAHYAAKSPVTQPRDYHISRGEPKQLKDLLAGNDLSQLVERAREAGELDARVRALLPEDLAAHVTGAVLHEHTVVVLTDSAAWATRIRFHARELVARLAPRYDGAVTRLHVKVRPAR